MKTAMYVNNDISQVVLTPENDFEQKVIDEIYKNESKVEVLQGSFGTCQGGWVRKYGSSEKDDNSLIIALGKKQID